MKPAQINKLYTKFTSRELAALAFEACARNDTDNMKTIVSTVERHEYRMPDIEYLHRANGFVYLAWFYRGEFYKTLAKGLSGFPDGVADECLSRLTAMDEALNQVCNQLHVDVQAVKKAAGCPAELEPISQGENHAELVKKYADLFISLF